MVTEQGVASGEGDSVRVCTLGLDKPSAIDRSFMIMNDPSIDAARKVVLAYYGTYSPLRRGLAERGLIGLPDFQAMERELDYPGKSIDPYPPDQLLHYLFKRIEDEQVMYNRVRIGCLSDGETIRHAQRILALWFLEYRAIVLDTSLVPYLLIVDGDYLLWSVVVDRIQATRICGPTKYDTEKMDELSKCIGKIIVRGKRGFANPANSRPAVKMEYRAIMEELKDPSPVIPIDTTDKRRHIGFYDVITSLPSSVERDPGKSDEFRALKTRKTYKPTVICRSGDLISLSGLEKIVALFFPFVLLTRNNDGEYILETQNLDQRGKLLEEKWTSLCSKLKLVGTTSPRGGRPKSHKDFVLEFLTVVFDLSTKTIDQYQRSTIKPKVPEILNYDGYRDWGNVEDLVSQWYASGDLLGVKIPITNAATSPAARRCGIDKEELLAITEYRAE